MMAQADIKRREMGMNMPAMGALKSAPLSPWERIVDELKAWQHPH